MEKRIWRDDAIQLWLTSSYKTTHTYQLTSLIMLHHKLCHGDQIIFGTWVQCSPLSNWQFSFLGWNLYQPAMLWGRVHGMTKFHHSKWSEMQLLWQSDAGPHLSWCNNLVSCWMIMITALCIHPLCSLAAERMLAPPQNHFGATIFCCPFYFLALNSHAAFVCQNIPIQTFHGYHIKCKWACNYCQWKSEHLKSPQVYVNKEFYFARWQPFFCQTKMNPFLPEAILSHWPGIRAKFCTK